MDSNSTANKQDQANETNELLKTLKEDLASRHQIAMRAIEQSGSGSLVKVVLPIVLTAVLGLVVWYFQNQIQKKADANNLSIQSKVEENNRLLSTRLALTEEFYKRKLDAYEKTCTWIARLEESLDRYDELQINPEVGTQATDSMRAVDLLSKSDFLYLSSKFKSQLGDLWDIGRQRMVSGSGEPDMKKKLSAQIKSLREEMNLDLHTSDLNWLPSQPGK